MHKLRALFVKKPFLAWFVGDKQGLSEESMVENILNYGSWEDYLEAEKDLGVKKISSIFESLKNKRRVNLKPKTINYFSHYFTKYA